MQFQNLAGIRTSEIFSFTTVTVFVMPLLLLLLLLLLPSVYSVQVAAAAATAPVASCISYDSSIRLITITCVSANLQDIYSQLHDNSILSKLQSSPSSSSPPRPAAVTTSGSREWLLNANITIAKGATLYINSTDTSWLKINSESTTAAYGILVHGSLKIDSVKITSWNPSTNDYIRTITAEDRTVPRPYIVIWGDAKGTTDITNSEIAYLKYLSYYGGNRNILTGNHIHNLYFGFFSHGVAGMIVENNHVDNNGIYGIDPHTATHDMIIRNNTVHDDGSIDIICSLDCYNITVENNKVYNSKPATTGIMFSRNTTNSIAKNNIVNNEFKGIFTTTKSHNNEIYNNTISNSETGIYVNQGAYDNVIHDNTVMNPTSFGLSVSSGASRNTFYSNTIENSQHNSINVEGSDTTNNIFKNNKLINSSPSYDPIRLNNSSNTNTELSNNIIIRNSSNNNTTSHGHSIIAAPINSNLTAVNNNHNNNTAATTATTTTSSTEGMSSAAPGIPGVIP